MEHISLHTLKTQDEVTSNYFHKDIRDGMISCIVRSDIYGFINGLDTGLEYLTWLVNDGGFELVDTDIDYGGKYNGITQGQETISYDKKNNIFNRDTIEEYDFQPDADYERTQFFFKRKGDKKNKISKIDLDLIRRYEELSEKINNFDSNIIARIQNQKSKLKSCDSCGSKISAVLIKAVYCPICNDENFGYTNTDKETLANYKIKLASMKTKYSSIKNKMV